MEMAGRSARRCGAIQPVLLEDALESRLLAELAGVDLD
jgi:hypothetical protein